MNERLNESLRSLFDGELDHGEAGRVLRDAADDVEALALLNLEFRMRRAFGEQQESSEVPEGFSDRVMKQVQLRAREAESPEVRASTFRSRLSRVFDALIMPRPVVVRPAYVAGVLVVLSIGIVLALSGRIPSPQPVAGDVEIADQAVAADDDSSDQVLVPFVYISRDASTVAVAGDFNDWEPTGLQRQEVNGRIVWTGHIPVRRGEHRYMFVVNGSEWESDPLAPVQRDDGFGKTNAILAL